MTAQRIFYIFGMIFLLLILIWQLSEAAPPYPLEIQQRIKEATKITCEIQTPRKVSTIFYREVYANWLIRVFTKDGEELEIWFDESIPIPPNPFALFLPDKIYYYENGQWLDQNALSDEEARRLDRRLKFTGAERRFLKECFEKQFMKQLEKRSNK